jgi:hypothetical protein
MPAPRVGTARGVLLVEAPRSSIPEAFGPVEAAAAAAARLPQLVRRCNLADVAGAALAPAARAGARTPPTSLLADGLAHSSGGGGGSFGLIPAAAAAGSGGGGGRDNPPPHATGDPAAEHHHSAPNAQPGTQSPATALSQQHYVGSWPLLSALRTGGALGAGSPGAVDAAALAYDAGSGTPRGLVASAASSPGPMRAEGRSSSTGGGAAAASGASPAQPPAPASWLGLLFLGGTPGGGAGAPGGGSSGGDKKEAAAKDGHGAALDAGGAGGAGATTASTLMGSPLRQHGDAHVQWRGAPAGSGSGSGSATHAEEGMRAGPLQQQLVAVVGDALSAAAGKVGVVHLALRSAPTCCNSSSNSSGGGSESSSGGGGGLVAGWVSRVFAVVEPSPEATRLAAECGAAFGHAESPVSGCGGGLASLLAGRACLELRGGGLLAVLSQQLVRTPHGALVTSWMFMVTEPAAGAVLDAATLTLLAGRLARVVVVSSGRLQRGLSRTLLRAGARAVVAPAAEEPAAATSTVAAAVTAPGESLAVAKAGCAEAMASADEVEAFFTALYHSLLEEGVTVPEAVVAAEAAAPALRGVYVCHHL